MTNPSEISQILKQQLESVNRKVSFEETGSVLEVGDGVAHVYFFSCTYKDGCSFYCRRFRRS